MKPSKEARCVCSIVVVFVLSLVTLGSVPTASAIKLETGGPGEAYLAYRTALDVGKLKKVKKYLSTVKVYELISKSDDEAIASLKILDPIEGLEVVDESVDGDHATVTARGDAMGMAATGTIEMIRENGSWKLLAELWELGGDSGAGEPVEPGASIQEAARAGDAAAVTAAIEAGVDVNAFDDSDRTALSWAANFGHTEVMDLLITSGAGIDLATEDGEPPLLIAASAGEPGALAFLIEAGANVNVTDQTGSTALIRVAQMSDWSVERLPNGEADAAEMIRTLTEAGAEVDYADPWQSRTALMEAAVNGRTEMVRALLAAGADVNRAVSVDDGTTAVMEAAKSGNVETFAVLVDAGADLGGADRTGRTVVDWAADYPDIVQILSAQGIEGADSATSSLEEMRCAEDDPQPAIARLKAKGYAEVSGSQFLNAAARGDSEAVMLFVRAGVPVNTKDEHDHASTALNRAVTNYDNTDAVFILLSCGADPNAGTIAPLIRVADRCESTEVVQALLEAGADPNTKAPSGFSALQFANMSNCEENARVLREAGAVEKE